LYDGFSHLEELTSSHLEQDLLELASVYVKQDSVEEELSVVL
jgi:hypothetical protein